MAMKPKRCVTTTKGNGKSLEEMSGGRGRVPRASSLRYSLAEGVDGVDGIFSKPSQCLGQGMQSTPASWHAEMLGASLCCTPSVEQSLW